MKVTAFLTIATASSLPAPSAAGAAPAKASMAAKAETSGFVDQMFTFSLRVERLGAAARPHTSKLSQKSKLSVKMPIPKATDLRTTFAAWAEARAREHRKMCFQGLQETETPSLRANGSRQCAPDDRIREAIQLLCADKGKGKLDCFVRCAPRNDGKKRVRPRGAMRPRRWKNLTPFRELGTADYANAKPPYAPHPTQWLSRHQLLFDADKRAPDSGKT